MPLPRISLDRRFVDEANAREFAKQRVLGVEPAEAAAEVGAPLAVVETHPAAVKLQKAIEPDEKALLRESDYETAEAALATREGRLQWLTGIITGRLEIEGNFGMKRKYSESARMRAEDMLHKMFGDYTIKHEITVAEKSIIVFQLPDNGRAPMDVIDAVSDE